MILMKYEEIKTPEELLKFMDEHITYGFVDDRGKVYTGENEDEFEEGCQTTWRLSSPERLLKVGYGHCFDQVEFERYWFLNNGYSVQSYFIWYELPYENPYSMHTYLIYEKDHQYYLFEHSDGENRGISAFSSLKDAIFYQKQNHIRTNERYQKITEEEQKHLTIYAYPKPPYHLTMNEFIDFILNNAKKIK